MSLLSHSLFSIIDFVTCGLAVAKLFLLRISLSEINPAYRVISYLLILFLANIIINILISRNYAVGWFALIISITVFLACGVIHNNLRRKTN